MDRGVEKDEVRRTLSDSGRSPAGELEPGGGQLGRYRLLELLGRGGMGEVYRAYDPGLDRTIAIKRLRYGGPLDDRARTRLLREAQVAARLCHTHVVQIFDVGIDELSSDAFIAMEYVDGETLRAWLRREHGWREIAEIFVQVGRGLLAAHEGGVVHRDFKPENVLLTAEGEAKVVDFGLAKPVADRRPSRPSEETIAVLHSDRGLWRATEKDLPVIDEHNTLTPEGARLGTPAYMPPEQICSKPSDPRSDQYSFAVSIYEALTGQLPFPGTSSSKYAMAVLDGNVRPFPKGGPVPRRLRRAIMRALGYRPEDRFRTLRPLLAELARVRRGPRIRSASMLAGIALGGAIGLSASLLASEAAPEATECATAPRR